MRRPRRISRPAHARRGMTLVEVIVAIAITGASATGLAGMAYWAGRSSVAAAVTSARLAALTAIAERLSVTPYDALPAAAGCEENGDPQLGYLNCVRVDDLAGSTSLRRVTILVTPNNGVVGTDSVVFERAKTPPPSPF